MITGVEQRAGRRHRGVGLLRGALAVVVFAIVAASCSGAGTADGPTASTRVWLALGDSFSSGVGSDRDPGATTCDRQLGAFPVLARAALESSGWRFTDGPQIRPEPPSTGLAACAGATTDHYWSEQEVDVFGPIDRILPAQRTHLDDSVDIVTITLGGNDLGFGPVLIGCVTGGLLGGDCDEADLADRDLDDLEGRLQEIYVDIRTRMADGGHLFVVGYPPLFADPDTWTDSTCERVDADEARELNDAARSLDDAVRSATASAAAEATNVHYVALIDAFEGAGLCGATTTPLIRGINLRPISESFHPSAAGHSVMADALVACMRMVVDEGRSCVSRPPS